MRLALLAAATATTLAFSPARADVEYDTQTYTLSAVVVSGNVAGENIGGVSFGAPLLTPTKVTAADATTSAVSLLVAQDPNGDGFFGDPGEAAASGCGEVDLSTSEVAFDPSLEIGVFVSTVDVDCVGGIATTGAVTLFVAS